MASYTKQLIINTFIQLLNERPLDKITVKDIVAICGINRNTFLRIPFQLYFHAYPYLCFSSASPQRFSYICTEIRYSIRSNRKTTARVKRLIGSSVFVRITRSMA